MMQVLALAPQPMLAFALNVARLCIWLVLLVAVFAPLERLLAVRPCNLFRRDFATDLGRVDGFSQDQATRECDEGTVALGSLFASQGDTLEAFQLAHRLLDAGSGFVERFREKCRTELGI